jgi:hypothetical protein
MRIRMALFLFSLFTLFALPALLAEIARSSVEAAVQGYAAQ